MDRHQKYNIYKRDRKSKRFYNSKAWLVCRHKVLVRDYYVCQECLKRKIIKAYDVVHHIKPLREYPKLSLTEINLVSLCHSCHNQVENKKQINNSVIKIIEIENNPEMI